MTRNRQNLFNKIDADVSIVYDTNRSYRKYIMSRRANFKQGFIFGIVVVVAVCMRFCPAVIAEQSPEATPTANGVNGDTQLSTQLRVNKDTLLNNNAAEQIRTDAALVMLTTNDPNESHTARGILLDILRQKENREARIAICRALHQAQLENKSIPNRTDFLPLLFEIILNENDKLASAAAEATALFTYDELEEIYEQAFADPQTSVQGKRNLIHTIKMQPDKRAILKLIDLLSHPDAEITTEASSVLKSLGVPVSSDPHEQAKIRSEIEWKGKEEFLRDWKIRQNLQHQKEALMNERDLWRGLYLNALDKLYASIPESERANYLLEYLNSEQPAIRLWALKKVEEMRIGTAAKHLEAVAPSLIGLIADPDTQVRLQTARLLTLMDGIDCAAALMQQHQIEQNETVRTEQFSALSVAVYYASLPTAKFKLPDQLRTQTLELATQYLNSPDETKAVRGQAAIAKLLEQNGLPEKTVEQHLNAMVTRYEQAKNQTQMQLAAELMNSMATLCAQSVYRQLACLSFTPLYHIGITDENTDIREAAVVGLIYSDKTQALPLLKTNNLNDTSTDVRNRLMNLAGEVGSSEDLEWLFEKLSVTEDHRTAWKNMLLIFKRNAPQVIEQWTARFEKTIGEANPIVSLEQYIAFLELAEAKLPEPGRTEVKKKIANLSLESNNYEKAITYIAELLKNATTPEEKETYRASLLNAYLQAGNYKAAAELIKNRLLETDIAADHPLAQTIQTYLSNSDKQSQAGLLVEINQIQPPEQHTQWPILLQQWREIVTPAPKPKPPVDPNQTPVEG